MTAFSRNDSAHMVRALQLAEQGQYTARPNPMVGCVIVKDDTIVGEGWHQRAGAAHAEINALQAAAEHAAGASVFVTLEPCAHHGRTPPCAEALINARVARVVVAIEDPHAAVSGRGLESLRAAGIEVEVGLMAVAAAALNEGFISRMTRGRPFVRLKVAASLDGAIAMNDGESQWITGPAARDDVQRLRARSGAIMTGIGTVLADDPSLTVRSTELPASIVQPMRVVLDSRLRMPLAAAMLTLPGTTLVCYSGDDDSNCNPADPSGLVAAGARVWRCDAHAARVDARAVLEELARQEVNDVLVEAGPVLTGHLLEHQLADELVIYQSPHIMGSQTRRMFDTPSLRRLSDRLRLDIVDARRIGDDTRISARPAY
jgi:diaminohydroxyphosphoribosylaminopyrimidine deaminase/5-amino-6-(5-phosphoribosylamino)uracil reductase